MLFEVFPSVFTNIHGFSRLRLLHGNSKSVLIKRVILHRKFNKHNWKALPYGSVLYADSSRYLCRRLLKLPTACDSFSTLNDMSTGNKIRWKFASAANYLGNNQKKNINHDVSWWFYERERNCSVITVLDVYWLEFYYESTACCSTYKFSFSARTDGSK